METFLYIVFFVSCVVMVVSVLLQPGKTDAGALFTSGVSKAALNPRGTQSVLSKLTIVMATVFMLTALLLSLPALTGNVSVLQTQGESDSAPASNSNSNANTSNTGGANTNATNTDAGSSNTAENSSAKPADEKGVETKETKPDSAAKSDDAKKADQNGADAENKKEEKK